jgi:LacI family transcriptional regulator, repressor for deo operon, udp, cdd, tsx, nupC, and nupG
MNTRPTIRDVAAKAGLSIASVSRALTDATSVREDTRRRVIDAARELDFRLNRQAINFRRGRSNALIVLVSNIENPFYAEFFKGAEMEARSRGYVVLIGDTASDPSSERTYVDMLLDGRADGLITNIGRMPDGLPVTPNDPSHVEDLAIVACNHDAGITVPSVRIDNYHAGQTAAAHLLGLGHRRFAVIHGSLRYDDFQQRLNGFVETIAAAGCPLDPKLLIEGDLSIESGRAAVRYFLEDADPPTAIFSHNDEMALGAMHELSLHGIEVPAATSVMGFDDLNYASAVTPTLSTMRLPRREWGAITCRRLLQMVLGEPFPHETVLSATLIARQSTGPAPSR